MTETYEKLCPPILRTHVHPAEEQTDRDRPCVEEHARKQGGVLVGFHDQEVALDVACRQEEVYSITLNVR